MVSKFIVPFKFFNLVLLALKKREEIFNQMELTHIEVVEIFEYRKLMIDIGIKLNYIDK